MFREAPKIEGLGIPKWMVSFSDMMTNLLCFFILMVSLASRQEAGFVSSGIGSHLERLEALGLPGIKPSTRTLIPQDSPLARYKAPRIDPLDRDDWASHSENVIREEFDRLRRVELSEEDPGRRFPVPLGIKFSPQSARLTLSDRQNLELLAPALCSTPGTVEVHGYCAEDEAATVRDRFRLSLQRAQAVERYLTSVGVPAERLSSFGAGVPSRKDSKANADPARRKVVLQWWLE